MKKNAIVKFVGGIVLVGGLLTACGTQNSSSQDINQAAVKKGQQEEKHPTTQATATAKNAEVSAPTTTPPASTTVADGQRQLKTIKTAVGATGKVYQLGPIKLTLNEVTLKEVLNASPDELTQLEMYTNNKKLDTNFYYIHIKYTAENNSTQNVVFQGIQGAVLFQGTSQESIDNSTTYADFIRNDNDQDGVYYGHVVKTGEVGFIVNTSNPDKLRLDIGGTMTDKTYNSLADDVTAEFPMK